MVQKMVSPYYLYKWTLGVGPYHLTVSGKCLSHKVLTWLSPSPEQLITSI